ncbi:MAG: hypothetical protein ABI947_22485 [Chloroflexota bacterium]
MYRRIPPRLIRTTIIFLAVILSLTAFRLPSAIRSAAAQGDVLLSDQFQDNTNNWKLTGTKSAKMTIQDGAITFDVAKENVASWATPEVQFPDDIDVSVDATVPEAVAGQKWNAAIIIRADLRDTDSGFYQFEITGEGQWNFVVRTAKGAKYETVKSGTIKSFQPADPHTLLVSARGTTFVFSIDAKEVGTFSDSSVNNDGADKYVGLLAGTFTGESSASIQFSNFSVTGTKPTPTLSVDAGNNSILFKEDFSDPKTNGWPTKTSKTSSAAFADNSLIIKTFKGTKDGILRWIGPAADLPADVDVTVTVDADEKLSVGSYSYGVGVRYYANKNNDAYFYLFQVLNTGEWMFTRYNGADDPVVVVERTKIKSFSNKVANKINITAVGNHFEFFINNKKVGEADDDQLEVQKSYTLVLTATCFDEKSSAAATFTGLVVAIP